MKRVFEVTKIEEAINSNGERFGDRMCLTAITSGKDVFGQAVETKHNFWYTVQKATVEVGTKIELEASVDQDGNWSVDGFTVRPKTIVKDGKEIVIRQLYAAL